MQDNEPYQVHWRQENKNDNGGEKYVNDELAKEDKITVDTRLGMLILSVASGNKTFEHIIITDKAKDQPGLSYSGKRNNILVNQDESIVDTSLNELNPSDDVSQHRSLKKNENLFSKRQNDAAKISTHSTTGELSLSKEKLMSSMKVGNLLDKSQSDEASIRRHSSTFTTLYLSKGTLIDTLVEPPNNFMLTFQLCPYGTVSEWSSILRFTGTDHDRGRYGDRWLHFAFEPESLKLEFIAGSTSHPHQFVPERDGVEQAKWNDIQVVGTDHEIELRINNISKGKLTNIDRPLLPKVEIYASDKFHILANAIIRDFKFVPLTPSKTNDPTSSPTLLLTSPPTSYETLGPTSSPTYYPT